MLIDLHHSPIGSSRSFFSSPSLESFHDTMVYNGVRLSIVSLFNKKNKLDALKREMARFSVLSKEHGYILVKSKKNLQLLETSYIPRLAFHLCIPTHFITHLDEETIKLFKLQGVHSVCFTPPPKENVSDIAVENLFKNKFMVDVLDLQKESFLRMLKAFKSTAFISSLDLLHLKKTYSNSTEGLEALFLQGGIACFTFHDLNRLSLPTIVKYAVNIKELTGTYGSDKFSIATNDSNISKYPDKISPISVLRTELLRVGMSDKDLDDIFFKTAFNFLHRII